MKALQLDKFKCKYICSTVSLKLTDPRFHTVQPRYSFSGCTLQMYQYRNSHQLLTMSSKHKRKSFRFVSINGCINYSGCFLNRDKIVSPKTKPGKQHEDTICQLKAYLVEIWWLIYHHHHYHHHHHQSCLDKKTQTVQPCWTRTAAAEAALALDF